MTRDRDGYEAQLAAAAGRLSFPDRTADALLSISRPAAAASRPSSVLAAGKSQRVRASIMATNASGISNASEVIFTRSAHAPPPDTLAAAWSSSRAFSRTARG